MDAATELTWTYLQRPPQPDPPRHPTDSPAVAVEVAGQRPALPLQQPTHRSGRCQPWLAPSDPSFARERIQRPAAGIHAQHLAGDAGGLLARGAGDLAHDV